MKKRIFKTFLIFVAMGIVMELLLSFIFSEIAVSPAIVVIAIFEASIYLIYCFIYSRKHIIISFLIFILIFIAIIVVLFMTSGQSANELFSKVPGIPFAFRVAYFIIAGNVAKFQLY